MLTALSRNLARRATADQWLRETAAASRSPDIAFVQEAPAVLLTRPPKGYTLHPGRTAPRAAEGCTSVLLVREDLGDIEVPELPFGVDGLFPFASLGTYVSCVRLLRPSGPLWLVSVHTSPSRVAERKLRPEFKKRSCERYPHWSDAFLAELERFTDSLDEDVVIAGDLNQALAYDTDINHTCGGEFLDAVRELGYVDVTVRDWHGERSTRFERPYHLDRVFAAGEITGDISVNAAELIDDGVSDHAAVWFTINR